MAALQVFCAIAFAAIGAVGAAHAQDAGTPPPAPPPRSQFFAGTVTALDAQHITVSRTLVGKGPEQHTFLVNADTKMNKAALKVKSRVTVEYQHMPEGDLAIEIQMRTTPRNTKPS